MRKEAGVEPLQIIRRAALGCLVRKQPFRTAGPVEHLRLAHAAVHIKMSFSRDLDKVHDDQEIFFPVVGKPCQPLVLTAVRINAAERVIESQRADDLRNMLIAVHILQRIEPRFHRIEQLRIQEEGGAFQMRIFPRQAVQLHHRAEHAAVFSGNIHAPHLSSLFAVKPGKPVIDPVAHGGFHRQRGLISGVQISIIKTGHDLIQGIIRRPDLRIRRIHLQQIELRLVISREEARFHAAAR